MYVKINSITDIYSVSDGLPSTFPLGARVNLIFSNFLLPIFQQRVDIFSLSQRRFLVPSNITIDLEINSITVTFNNSIPSLTGDNVLCVLNIPDSRRRKRIPINQMKQCGSIVNLNITSE